MWRRCTCRHERRRRNTPTTYEYDALGRPTRTEQNVAPFAVTTTDYLSGYRVRVTDPRGNATTTHWLAFGAPAPTGPQQGGDGPA